MNINSGVFDQFHRFCMKHGYLHSWDIDPVYPVLQYVHQKRYAGARSERDREDMPIWHTLLYVIWYHLGSAETVLSWYPRPAMVREEMFEVLPTGIERRGFRGEAGTKKAIEMVNHFGRLSKQMTLKCWVDNECNAGGIVGWNRMYEAFINIHNNGTWAAYKWCDLCKNVLGYEITAPDIGVGGGGEEAGPVPGMVQLTGEDWHRCARDTVLQEELLEYCHARGIPFDGLEEMETALCDFNSWSHGRYYPGHDIDKQQEDFISMNVPEVYWEARREVFPREFLGELNGWTGVRQYMKGVHL